MKFTKHNFFPDIFLYALRYFFLYDELALEIRPRILDASYILLLPKLSASIN
jgi:hypothetical protein